MFKGKRGLIVIVTLVLFTSIMFPHEGVQAADGNWRRIADMNEARGHGPAGVVLNNGDFLVIGGASGEKTNQISRTVELYDKDRDRWVYKAPMKERRLEIEAVTLDDGRVLVPGGRTKFSPDPKPRATNTVEIYNPKTNTWSYAAPMKTPRRNYRMVKLLDGRVLVAGGRNDETQRIRSMEIYDPKSNTWSSVGNMRTTRFSFVMEVLANGKILFAGGTDDNGKYQSSAEIYDPQTKKWTTAASMTEAKAAVKSGRLRDGRILVMGGRRSGTNLDTVEVYRPEDNSWEKIGELTSVRRLPAAAILPDGHVIAAGGRNRNNKELKTAEIGYFNHAPIVKLSSPANDSVTNANNNRIELRWTASDIEGDRITNYRLKIGTSPGASDVANTSGSWRTSYTFDFSGRPPNQTYYWTVMARDELGDWSDWAPTRSFTVRNRTPEAVFQFSPSKTDRLRDVSFVNMSSDPDGDSLTYKWEYRLQGSSGWKQFSTTKEPRVKFPEVGIYDLRLTVTDPYGASHSNTKTGLEIYNLAPEIEPLFPPSGYVTEMGQTKVELKWRANDPEKDGMNQYRLKIGTTPGGDDVLSISGNWITTYTFDFSHRNPNQTYYWSVMGRDVHGDWSSWSPVQSFVVPKQLEARVEHAPRWEELRRETGRAEHEFLAGEPFIIVAETSDKAVEVFVESPFDTGPKRVELTKDGDEWRGSFYDPVYENLTPGTYEFKVTSRYHNGYEESVNVPITIRGKLSVKVHRTY